MGYPVLIPEPELNPELPTEPGIDGCKMNNSYNNIIEFFAGEKQLRKAIAGIVIDSTPVATPKNPDKCHLFAIISFFLDEGEKALLRERSRAIYRRGSQVQ
jgi:tryptophanyl-tRNA synthetase